MRRREFIAGIAGAAAMPLVAHAQQPLPTIGFLGPQSPERWQRRLDGFRKGLAEAGMIENQTVRIEYRWASGRYDQLSAMAAELVSRKVDVIVAGLAGAPFAAKSSTTTIPIVFVSGADPVKEGLVASFNRPGGNITGISVISLALVAKRLELLREMVPGAATVAVLVNPDNPTTAAALDELQDAVRTLNLRLHVLRASKEQDFGPAFDHLLQHKVQVLLVVGDAFFTAQRDRLVALAAQHAVAASFAVREFPDAGGLMSYGPSFTEAFRHAGNYAGRILKGTPPAELPVTQPTQLELVINLKTAKALSLSVPPTLIARADEVIE